MSSTPPTKKNMRPSSSADTKSNGSDSGTSNWSTLPFVRSSSSSHRYCLCLLAIAGGSALAAGPVAFEVRDKLASLKADDWVRVVAVFVLGKEWQFKDWPFKGHVDIFNKVIGFFVCFEDDSVDSAKVVKQWNVKIISISKNKRHQDRPAALEVWDRLDEFVRARS
ncbi:protein CDC73 homolog [Triticum aestivum]|uniref:protein CDC73 homolog n=1 Tax=Triticum aestivum TaxID=4565 RepID=UPI001D0053C7|nr:protein CDC73 homolog [Triticum aestivum]